jgi:hypothetical protein
MSGYASVVKVKKASFAAGKTPIKSLKHGKNKEGVLKGGFIVGNQGLELEITVQPGGSIMTEQTVDPVTGYPKLLVFVDPS